MNLPATILTGTFDDNRDPASAPDTKVCFPNIAHKLVTSFCFYQPTAGLTPVLNKLNLTDSDISGMFGLVLGLDPEPSLGPAAPHNSPSEYLRKILESEEFQRDVVRLILNAYPEKRRLIHIHIPKCAGTHLRARLEVRYPTVSRALEAAIWTPKMLFFETLHQIATSIPFADEIFVHGHTSISWYLKNKLCRPDDFAFAVVRNPLEIIVSQVNYVVTRFLEDPAFIDPDTAEWSGLLSLAPKELDRSAEGLVSLARRILREPSLLTRNPLCEYLGEGSFKSALCAISQSNIEITDLPRYDSWFEQKFGIPAGIRENVSKKILKISELEFEEIRLLQNLVDDQDKELFEMISAALDRSEALSVRGAELHVYKRLRMSRPLKMYRRSSVLWRSLRMRFSVLGGRIRNFFSALHMVDAVALAEGGRCGALDGCPEARPITVSRSEKAECLQIEPANDCGL